MVSGFNGSEDIDSEYNDFENRKQQEEIEVFANKENIDKTILSEYIAEYAFSGVINQGEIRDNIQTPMSLLKKKSLVNRIVDFIRSLVDKYSG